MTIDPSLQDDQTWYSVYNPYHPGTDGYIVSGSDANTSFFTQTYEKIGWDSSYVRRTLNYFDVGGTLPVGAQILNAKFKLYLTAESSSTQASVGVYSATQSFTSSATWNKYDGTHSWTTAGGDFTGEIPPQSSTTPWAATTVGGTLNTYYYWDVTQLVRGWENGTIPNRGLLAKYVDETHNANLFTFNSMRSTGSQPGLAIWYDLGKGSQPSYSSTDFTLDDSTTASVNDGDGNLLVCQQDFSLPGVAGFGLNLQHCWNSNSGDPHQQSGYRLGGWMMPGTATYLDAVGTSVIYHSETSVEVPFTPDGHGGYLHTVGFDAALTASTGTLSGCSSNAYAYILTMNADGSKQYFNATGQLVAEADRNGNDTCYTYASGTDVGPSTITDAGRTVYFCYATSGITTGDLTGVSLTSSTCPTGSGTDTYTYGYDGGGRLSTSTDPTGAATTYGYDINGNLSTVQDPRGNTTTFAYSTDGYNNSIWEVTQPAHSSHPTVFTYDNSHSFCSSETTDVTSPNGYTTEYCRDNGLRITNVNTPDGAITSTDYGNTTDGGSNCVDQYGDSLDDKPCSTESGNGYWTSYGYDSTGQKRLWVQNPVQTSSNRSTWAFGDSSHPYYPTSYTDADGNITSYTYTSAGDPCTKTDGAGNTTFYTYNSNGELASTQTGLTMTRTVTCPSSAPPCPSSGTPTPICPTTTYVYDSQGNLIEEKDGLGNITSYGYDGAGDRTCETDGLAYSSSTNTFCGSALNYSCPSTATYCPVTSTTYDGVGRVLTVTRQRDATTSYTTQHTYDGDGNQTSETDGLSYNSATQTYYCPSGSTCPVTSETYDANNQLLSETDPANQATGLATKYSYDADGNQLTVTDPDGNQTLYGYDAVDQQTSMQSGLNSSGVCPTNDTCPITQSSYDLDGNLATQTDPNGYTTLYGYDQADELTSEASGYVIYQGTWCPTGDTCPTTTLRYDAAGNQIAVLHSDPATPSSPSNLSETLFTYDGDNRQSTITDGLTSSGTPPTYGCAAGATCPEVVNTYDNNGNLATSSDPDGCQVKYIYNLDNQVSSETSGIRTGACPAGSTQPQTAYTYDNVGNESTVTQTAEPNTPTTSYTYYADGSLHTTTDPMGNVVTDTYDNVGNVISEQTPKGTTTSCYDADRRLLASYYSTATCGTGTPDVSYTFDAAGNELTASANGPYGVTTETTVYTNLERPESITTSEPTGSSTTLTGSFQYTYDSDGNITQRIYPDGTNVYYSFNNNDRLCRVGSSSGSSCTSGTNYVTYGYDANNNLWTSTHPSGAGNFTETRSYDNAGRLTNVSTTTGSNTIAAYAYTLDASGNPTNTVRTGWDPVNSNWNLNCAMSGSYDNNERLIGSTYTNASNGCPTQNNDAYTFGWTYDADGNWQQSTATNSTPTTTTTYDKVNADDQLCAVSTSGPPASCGSGFSYDGNGNETADSQTGNSYTFNLANSLTSATSGGSTTTATYDANGNQLSQTAGGTTTYYFWDLNTDPTNPQLALAEDGSGAVTARYVYGQDRISETTSSGTNNYVYDALGSPVNMVSNSGSISGTELYDPYGAIRYSSGSIPATTFAGLRSSGVSSIDASASRAYDMNTGRFLSQDPLGTLGQTSGTYTYGDDNPYTFSDPTGLSYWCNHTSNVHKCKWINDGSNAICATRSKLDDWVGKNLPPWVYTCIQRVSTNRSKKNPIAAVAWKTAYVPLTYEDPTEPGANGYVVLEYCRDKSQNIGVDNSCDSWYVQPNTPPQPPSLKGFLTTIICGADKVNLGARALAGADIGPLEWTTFTVCGIIEYAPGT